MVGALFLNPLFMQSVNKVILIGHLAADPELRQTPAGTPVGSFKVATNHSWKNADGERQEVADFHNIVAWRGLGEVCAKYLTKGSAVYVEGRLKNDHYKDKEGKNRPVTEIIAETVKFITVKGNKKVEDIQLVEVEGDSAVE